MQKRWTNEQQQALDAVGNLLVTASAGTGKTAVLTEKVLRLLLQKEVPIERILVVTFSKAAAAEMLERIKRGLWDVIRDKNTTKNMRQTAFRQVQRLADANICTIHSFCNGLLQEYFYKLDISARAKTATGAETSVMLNAAIKEVLEREYSFPMFAFDALSEYADSTQTLQQMLLSAYLKIRGFTSPQEWMKSATEKYSSDSLSPELIEMIAGDFDKAIGYIGEAINEMKLADNPPNDKILVFEADKASLADIKAAVERGEKDAITESTFEGLFPTVRFVAKDGDMERVKRLRQSAKDALEYYMKGFSINAQITRANMMLPVAEEICRLYEEIDEAYSAKKKAAGLIDFADMEHLALELLQDENLARSVSDKFTFVFVDEYQDTNPAQEAIIKKIANKNNLICVGDLKQSIYGFRSADPLNFTARSEDYSTNGTGAVVALNRNFRSGQNILDSANDVFDYITEASKEIKYESSDVLIHGRTDKNDVIPTQVHLVSKAEMKEKLGISSDESEAYNIVKVINDVLGQPMFDTSTGENRPITYSDIAVISRKLSGISEVIAQVFTANGIPYNIDKSGELLDSLEITLLMNLISLVNNPRDEIKLISVMHEGFFELDDYAIIEVRKLNEEKSFYENCIDMMQTSAETGLFLKKLFNFFDECKKMEETASLREVVDFIIQKTLFLDHVAAKSNGKKRIANVELFRKMANDFNDGGKLLAFENYVNSIATNVGDAKENYGEGVTVTTIHHSKGLEYPVVILAFTGKNIGLIDKTANLIIDKDAGFGLKYCSVLNNGLKEKAKNLQRIYVERHVEAKAVEEEMRLLYVAMTRAQDRLIIQGTSDGFKGIALEDAKSHLDWILSTVARGSVLPDDTVKLSGVWKVVRVEAEDIQPYITANAKPVSDKDFLNQFPGVDVPLFEKTRNIPHLVPKTVSSSMLHKAASTVDDFKFPTFEEGKMTATERGTITHTFFKHADFKGDVSVEGIKAQMEDMVQRGIMSSEETKAVNVKQIAKFFTTDFGKCLTSADEYIRELPMSVVKTASELAIAPTSDEVLVRCIADLIFVKNGKYYLVDYKTDYIEGGKDEEIAKRADAHRAQIEMYAEAFSRIYKKSVDEKVLIFLNAGKAVTI